MLSLLAYAPRGRGRPCASAKTCDEISRQIEAFEVEKLMSTRKEIVSGYYDQIDEDGRLQKTRHGQLEYHTTMTYIHRHIEI